MTLFNLNKKPVPKGRWSQQQDGFALIITLTLMAFVVLLLVTLLTFSRVETTTASNSLRHNQARENARYALNMAIGELQRTAGHDNRITAQARLMDPDFDLLGAPIDARGGFVSPFWTGVWEPGSGDPRQLDNWHWLVSGNENRRLPRDQDFLPDTEQESDWITLVGSGSALWNSDVQTLFNRRLTPDPRVSAKLQPIYSEYPGLPSNPLPVVGRYAYWVGDEGVKASFGAAAHYDMSGDRHNQPLHMLTATRGGFEALPEDAADRDLFDPADERWARLLTLGQAALFEDIGLSREAIKRSFHSLSAYSQGVLSDPTTGRLKEDLTSATPADDLGDAIDAYLAGVTFSDFWSVQNSISTPQPDRDQGAEFQYPLRFRDSLTPDVLPVVKDFRLRGAIQSGGYQQPFTVELIPELVLWNPYTTDLTFFEGDDQTGYRFVMTLTNAENPDTDQGDGGGLPFDLQVGAGVHWKNTDGTDRYQSWVPGENFELFGLQGNTDDNNNPFLEFVSSEILRLRAGDAIILTGEELEFGPGNAGYDASGGFPTSFTFDPPPPADMPNASLDASLGSLFLDTDDLAKLGEIRLRVYAVPSSVNMSDQTEYENNRVLVVNRTVLPEALEKIQPPADYGSDQVAWEADWLENEEGAPQIQPYDPPPDFVKSEAAVFTLGFVVVNLVSPGNLTATIDFDPRDFDAGEVQDFYSSPDLEGWDDATTTDERFAYGFGTVAESRGMVLFDLPHDEDALTSIGQLQHMHLPGDRPFLVGDFEADAKSINEDLWDSFYFSSIRNIGSLPTNLSNIEFVNPRIRLHVPQGVTSSEVRDNLDSADTVAANLLVRGAFNVNSTSVDAWTIMLHGFFREDFNYLFWNDTASDYEDYPLRWDAGETDVPFPRFSQSAGLTYFGRIGADGVGNERSLWRNGFRELRPLDLNFPRDRNGNPVDHVNYTPINLFRGTNWDSKGLFAEEMARLIVAEIRDRDDPFTSVADFVNSGILQKAIDGVEWVAGDTNPNSPIGTVREGLNWYLSGNTWDQIPASSPSYLSQRDILARIGPFLTVRSDTFVIRTYGDSRNPVTGEIEARAYCEAIVQRVPQPANGSTSRADLISPPNSSMGRKFEIISFRWLDPSEI